MTITEYGKRIKMENEKFVVFIKYGKFYRCLDYDAYIMHYIFKYKLTSRDTIGFPTESLSKVLNVLKNLNISAIVIEKCEDYIIYDCLDNKYDIYLEKSL